MCARCDAESADYAAKAEAAYAANGWPRIAANIRHDLTHEEQLVEKAKAIIRRGLGSHELALLIIDAVREFDESTALMREAKDDHDQQNNEDPNDPPY